MIQPLHGDVASQGNDAFAELQVPPALLPSLERHRQNLARLVVSLQSVGLSEEQIVASVSVVIASYKEELLHAIQNMVREP